MIEDDRYCIDVLNQVQAIKAALGRAESEILKRHAACCVAEAIASGDADEQKQKFGELVDLFEKAKRLSPFSAFSPAWPSSSRQRLLPRTVTRSMRMRRRGLL